jgi:hypothetical protein
MHNKNKVWSLILLTLLLILFATIATAAKVKVAVVIEIPGEKAFTKCLVVEQGTNAFQILNRSSRDIVWSEEGPSGHGICSINSVGCPIDDCFCASEQSWHTYLKESGHSSWIDLLQTKSLDGGENCKEHYCAQPGDILSLIYADETTRPQSYSFSQICGKSGDLKDYYFATIEPKNPEKGDEITVKITDNKTNEGVEKAEVNAYFKDDKIYSGITDESGEYNFTALNSGTYIVKLNVKGYETPQQSLKIDVVQESETPEETTTTTPEETTTTITEETTSTTTEETTTTTEEPTTTTTVTTTTSTTEETTTTTLSEETTTTTEPEETNVPIGQVTTFPVESTSAALTIGILVIVASVTYMGYSAYKNKKTDS